MLRSFPQPDGSPKENSTDFAVAQQLLLLDRWESVVNKRNRRQDVTGRGQRTLEMETGPQGPLGESW